MQLLPQVPEKVVISFNQNGEMSRSFRRIRIENSKLKFEDLKGKWTSLASCEDLAELYRIFVVNKLDALRYSL